MELKKDRVFKENVLCGFYFNSSVVVVVLVVVVVVVVVTTNRSNKSNRRCQKRFVVASGDQTILIYDKIHTQLLEL
jgi:hypothetical protein